MDTLFEAIRKAASPRIWSRGVELARAGLVAGESENESEIECRVVADGGLSSHAVALHLEEEEWECDCASVDDPCEHVTGSVIAIRQARIDGKRLPSATAAQGRIGYRFLRQAGALAFERAVVAGERETPLSTTLVAVAKGRVDGPSFIATPADLLAERSLGTRLRGVLPRETMAALFEALSPDADIRLDGAPISISAAPVVPEGRLEDQGSGFRLFVELDSRIRERFTNGAVLVDDTLRPVGQTKLTARELEDYAKGVHFPPDDAARLVTEVLPSLADRIPFEVRTKRLPKTREEPPRVILETRREGDELVIFPTLVYGDPPRARVDSGRLVLLGGAVPLRDVRSEQRLGRQLQAQLGLLFGREERLAGAEAVRIAGRLETFDGELRGHGAEGFFLAPPLATRLQNDPGRFDLEFESVGTHAGAAFRGRADAGAVLSAWRRGDSLVPLLGGGFAQIPHEWLAAHGEAVADLLAARDPSGRLSNAALPDLARLCEALGEAPPADLEPLRALVAGFDSIPEAALPDDLRASLRDYQRRGVAWLQFLRDAKLGALLADDMGLGKTLQALCAVRGRTLVICPTSVLVNWAEEAARFRPSLRVSTYHGPKRELDPAADVTITTYAILRLDVEKLAAEAWDTVILDEAQTIKNAESQVAQAAFQLQGAFRATLSGTPVENRLDELWSQFRFLNPGLLGARDDFDVRYAKPIAAGTAGVAERLRQRIHPFVLRRLKRDVAPELPPRTEIVLRCELSAEERTAYETILAAAREEIVAKVAKGGSVLAALEALLRLRQACCHVGLLPGRSAETSAKLELLLEELETVLAEGHKALVFSQWTGLLDLIEPHLRTREVEFLRLDGSTRDRADVVRRFQEESGPPIMLVSLKAGGTGLNLTAADHVFLVDPWWNPAVEDQAADRTHRIGQTRPVVVYRLVAQDTVEERILALQGEKRAIAEAALGGAERAGGITRDDLLALLS